MMMLSARKVLLPKLLVASLTLLLLRMPVLSVETMEDQWNNLIRAGGIPKTEAEAIVRALYETQDEVSADSRRYELSDQEVYFYWRAHPPVDERNWEVYRKSAEQLVGDPSANWIGTGQYCRDLLRLRIHKAVRKQKHDLVRLVIADVNLAKPVLIDFLYGKQPPLAASLGSFDLMIEGAYKEASVLLEQIVAHGQVDFANRLDYPKMRAAFERWPNEELKREHQKLREILRAAQVKRDPLIADSDYQKIFRYRDFMRGR